jgi:cysteine sulfinate desulfinase/cysteine desulfurase-like protein
MVALGASREESNALVRFSLGRESTLEQVQVVEGVLPEVIAQVQGQIASPTR